jgi:hypothetical protein
VSPWLPNELRAVVCPGQVALFMVERKLTWRGLRRTIHGPHVVPCDKPDEGAPPWRAALQALEAVLPGFADGKTTATAILSNQFVHYTLVPWRAELADEKEDLSFARHCFTKVYGNDARQWELRLNQEAPEAPRLASAVDAELLAALKGVFGKAGIPLRSIQPHLMAVYNDFRGGLRQRSAWFALLEPGHLYLALLYEGRWARVRSLRIGREWLDELPQILERESYLADTPAVPHEVYVWDSGLGEKALPEIDSWQFHALVPDQKHATASAQVWPFAMAMWG